MAQKPNKSQVSTTFASLPNKDIKWSVQVPPQDSKGLYKGRSIKVVPREKIELQVSDLPEDIQQKLEPHMDALKRPMTEGQVVVYIQLKDANRTPEFRFNPKRGGQSQE